MTDIPIPPDALDEEAWVTLVGWAHDRAKRRREELVRMLAAQDRREHADIYDDLRDE